LAAAWLCLRPTPYIPANGFPSRGSRPRPACAGSANHNDLATSAGKNPGQGAGTPGLVKMALLKQCLVQAIATCRDRLFDSRPEGEGAKLLVGMLLLLCGAYSLIYFAVTAH